MVLLAPLSVNIIVQREKQMRMDMTKECEYIKLNRLHQLMIRFVIRSSEILV